MFLPSSKFEGFEINNSYISNYERGSLLLSVQGIDLLRYVFCENCFIIHRLSSGKYIFTARKRSLGQGNIFAPVCHSVHRGEYLDRYSPQAGTPPPPRQVQPTWGGKPPLGSTCWDTVNKRGYASYWNAFLYICQIGQIWQSLSRKNSTERHTRRFRIVTCIPLVIFTWVTQRMILNLLYRDKGNEVFGT